MESRIIEIDDSSSLVINQDLNHGYAGEVWDASLVLSHFLLKNFKSNKHLENKTVLELASGTGICGLICASLGADNVYLTDLKDHLDILENNIKSNLQTIKAKTFVKELDFTNENTYKHIEHKVDIIVASDIIWKPDLFPYILKTFEYFRSDDLEIYLSYQVRHKRDLEFFQELRKCWKIQQIDNKLLDKEYQANDILVFKLN